MSKHAIFTFYVLRFTFYISRITYHVSHKLHIQQESQPMLMSKRDRLVAATRGEETDRPLVALWRHFPVDDQDPEQLALSAVAFQSHYDWDFLKLTPSSSYVAEG